MSEKHMPGKLQVTVEIFDNDGCPETVIQAMEGAASVAVALDFGPNNPGMRDANARRLVACWNYCEDLDTFGMEVATAEKYTAAVANTTLIKRAEEADIKAYALTVQRDELLSALHGLLAIVNDSRGVAGYHMNGEVAEWDEFADEVNAASAAIAKATGGAL